MLGVESVGSREFNIQRKLIDNSFVLPSGEGPTESFEIETSYVNNI